ncbi:MAG: iron response transcriptional regulator IrrA [Pseudomonadota bacterium]
MTEKLKNIDETLRKANLRPTRQRVALAELLFSKGDRHVAAETLYEEARDAGVAVSLATIYNTLHQFTESGLLRAISIESNKTYFDTNTDNHHHFYIEGRNEVIDMPDGFVSVENLPEPPEGMEIARVDVVVRVRENLAK